MEAMRSQFLQSTLYPTFSILIDTCPPPDAPRDKAQLVLSCVVGQVTARSTDCTFCSRVPTLAIVDPRLPGAVSHLQSCCAGEGHAQMRITRYIRRWFRSSSFGPYPYPTMSVLIPFTVFTRTPVPSPQSLRDASAQSLLSG